VKRRGAGWRAHLAMQKFRYWRVRVAAGQRGGERYARKHETGALLARSGQGAEANRELPLPRCGLSSGAKPVVIGATPRPGRPSALVWS